MEEKTDLTLIQSKIHLLRGQRVMLDFDLAEFFEVETRALKQAIRRNARKFPPDFLFELNNEEVKIMVSQFVIPSKQHLGGAMPYAFTEQGVDMLASVLRSDRAIDMNITIVRAFVAMRRYAFTFAEVVEKLLDHDQELAKIVEVLNWLGSENQARHDENRATRQLPAEWEGRERIGFKP